MRNKIAIAFWFLLIALPCPAQRPQVAILIFDGVQIIDYTGPYEVFGQAGFRVFTVAESKEPITTSMGMQVIPAFTLQDHPEADVIVLPGGRVPHLVPEDSPIIKWIRENAGTDYLLSVCNGAFWLGSAGLLDGKAATTNAGMISHLSMASPAIKPVYDQRFVEAGNILTTGGLSAGIDGALHIVGKLKSPGRAREVANNMEYNWQPEGGYVRTQLADFPISGMLDFNPPLAGRQTLQYSGDQEQWVAEFQLRRPEGLEAFHQQFLALAKRGGWQKEGGEAPQMEGARQSIWKKTDFAGRRWQCTARFEQQEEDWILFSLENRRD